MDSLRLPNCWADPDYAKLLGNGKNAFLKHTQPGVRSEELEGREERGFAIQKQYLCSDMTAKTMITRTGCV
jgi:uncharacterized FlgJ-related protein